MLKPKVANCRETAMSRAKSVAAGEKPDPPQLTLRSMGTMAAIMNHFVAACQFRGSSLSPGLKATMLVRAYGARSAELSSGTLGDMGGVIRESFKSANGVLGAVRREC